MAEKEYIERKDLINNRPPQRNPNKTGQEEYNKGYNGGIKAFLNCVKEQPAADVAPVRHGRWVWKSNYRDYDGDICSTYSCSNCGEMNSDNSPYCPNCGAKMDGKEGEK